MIKKAFTILEIMLVVTIMAISLGLFALYSQASQVRSDLRGQTGVFVSHLRLTQSDAMSGKGNVDHGVHLEDTGYTVFYGSIYNVNNPNNEVITLPVSLTIQNILLNGGGSDILFTTPHGETLQYGSVDVTSTSGDSITISIGALGTVQY